MFVLLAALNGCSDTRGPQSFTYQGKTMGTTFNITVVTDMPLGQGLTDQIDSELSRINQLMSTYIDDSQLSQFNQLQQGAAIAVAEDFCYLLSLSNGIYKLTEGAFNPAVGPLVDLWGFGPTNTSDTIPDAGQIAELLGWINYSALSSGCSETGNVTKQGVRRLDFSAIAKGYATDTIGELLTRQGLTNYLVEVGGELALSGLNSRGTPWTIAIERPSVLQGDVQQLIALTGVGVATSGDYRNYFERDGKRYSHTIDPRTGRPVTHNLASVTIVAETTAEADALATAFMVMGYEQSLEIAEQQNIAAYFIIRKDDGFIELPSSHFQTYLNAVETH